MSHKESTETYRAQWGIGLQITTLAWFLALGLAGLMGFKYLAVSHRYWLWGAIGVYIVICWLIRVKAYRLRGTYIDVIRPLYTTTINAQSLRKMRLDGSAMQGVVPIFANPGMFCFNGWFHSERHGVVHSFVTDRTNIIRVKLNNNPRMYMFSPEHPEHFLRTLRHNTRPSESEESTKPKDLKSQLEDIF